MQYQVSIINSIKIVLQNGRRLVYSLPCDSKGALYMSWDTSIVEKSGDRFGQESRRYAIEQSPTEGYFSSHEQRIPRRFHFVFFAQLRKIYNIESWKSEDVKSMRTCWCYVIKPKETSSRGRRRHRSMKR